MLTPEFFTIPSAIISGAVVGFLIIFIYLGIKKIAAYSRIRSAKNLERRVGKISSQMKSDYINAAFDILHETAPRNINGENDYYSGY